MGRKLKPKGHTERDLARGYLTGAFSMEYLDAAGGDFFELALTTRGTRLNEIAAGLWKEIGPARLRKVKDTMPDDLVYLLSRLGWPPGDWKNQKKLYHEENDRRLKNDTLSLLTATEENDEN